MPKVRNGPVKVTGSKPNGPRKTTKDKKNVTRKNQEALATRNKRSAHRRWDRKLRASAVRSAITANATIKTAFNVLPKCCEKSPTEPRIQCMYTPAKLSVLAASKYRRPFHR